MYSLAYTYLIYTYLNYMYLIYIYIALYISYIPSPTYMLHYLNALLCLAYTLYIPLCQNLRIMTKTNMSNDNFLVIQSYMPCFCA